MELYLIRHAAAVPRSARIPDAARPLTKEGRRRWDRAVRGLQTLGVRFDRLYHSPWQRAVETAEALSALVEGRSSVLPALIRSPTAALLERIAGTRVALVGHQPWLGELVALLVFGSAQQGAQLELKKGSVVWLEGRLRPGGMALRALLPPRVLRAIGGS